MALIALILLAVIAGRSSPQPQASAPVSSDPPPVFNLRSADGLVYTNTSFGGQIAVLYFGYTFCPDICPSELAWIARVMRALGPESTQVHPILIGVDPDRDSPETLRAYATMFHERILALTGTPEHIAAAAASFGAIYQKSTPVSHQKDFYLIDHTMTIFVLGRDGSIALRLHSRDLTPVAAAAQIKRLLERP